jgi:hypothetical protein
MASTQVWGFLVFLLAIFLGVFAVSAANPPPNAVHSPTQTFFFFILPFFGLMIPFMILVGSVKSWLENRKYYAVQDVALSEDSIIFRGGDGSGTLPWTAFTRYKETPWSFIIWNPAGWRWMMFPKRAFTSPDHVQRCRDLFARHLAYSRWYLG